MPRYGSDSMKALNTCHPKLMRIAYEVIKDYDCFIIQGHRDEIQQNIAFEEGHSKVSWPGSNHNKKPSSALDAIPYPKKWKASDREFVELAAHFVRAAKNLGIKIELGMFFILKDGKHFFDGAHIQLAREEHEKMNLLPYIPLVLKAVAGKNVKVEMALSKEVIDRPFWLSGRFIGVVMTAVFGGFAAKIGMDLNASIANTTELVHLIADNKELLVAVGGMVAGIARGVAGWFQKI